MTQQHLEKSWKELYPKVYGYFFRRVNQRLDVEDLSSMTLSQYFQTLLDSEKSARVTNQNAYLWKIAHNQLVDFYGRGSKKIVTVAIDENIDGIDPKTENERSVFFKAKLESLQKCLRNQLSGVDLQILELSLIEDHKSYEVAEIVKLSADNVRQRLSRSVKKVRQNCIQIWQS